VPDEEVVGPAVEPIAAYQVKFYEDIIPVAQLADGRIYVPIRPITDALGLSSRGQRLRVLRHPVMAEDVQAVNMHGSDGKRRAFLSIPLQQLPGFLFGVDTNRVKAELQEKLLRYQRECFDALWQATAGSAAALTTSAAPALEAPANREMTSAERALALATTLQQLAAAQVEAERRMTGLDAMQAELSAKVSTMADFLRPFVQETRRLLADQAGRLGSIETRLTTITEAEAAEVALAVKNLAAELEKRNTPNGYARVHSILYRRFDVRSYYVLPHEKYELVLKWLRSWYDEVITQPVAAGGKEVAEPQ